MRPYSVIFSVLLLFPTFLNAENFPEDWTLPEKLEAVDEAIENGARLRMLSHRRKSRAPVKREKPRLIATGPEQIYSRDIPCLP